MSDLTDSQFTRLLSRAAEGDPSALEQLALQYEPKVRMVARVLLGPALRPYLESVDLAQSVHKSIMIGLRNTRYAITSPDQLIALALTIVRRKASRHWRHLRKQDRLSWGRNPDDGPTDHVLGTLQSHEADPAQLVQVNDDIRHLFQDLDETERRILERLAEGFSQAEVADLIGISRVALRVRLTRLRQRLRAQGHAADWF